MNKRLITAAVLSVIGAGIPALFLGLSLYTVVFFPVLTIVIIVSFWTGQRTKATWLGFLLFILCMYPVENSPGLIVLSALICFVSFFLVFSSFYSYENLNQTPPRILRIITALFIIVAAVAQLYEWSLNKQVIDLFLYHPVRLYMPRIFLYIYLVTPLTVYLSIIVLLVFGNRFVFYLLTPVLLVTNLLFALENVFKFFVGHISCKEVIFFLEIPYYAYIAKEYLIYDIFIVLSLIMVLLFMAKYRGKPVGN
jgi:hypothetical protein